jgi:membrane associated rhomboid family serine protease
MQFGRAMTSFSSRWSNGRIPLVIVMIALNVAIYLIQLISGIFAPYAVERLFALSREGIAQGYYWQFLTYMFLHGGVLHLLFNSLVLYFAGREVEQVCGAKHFLGVYLVGGLVGGVMQFAFSSAGSSLVGASGAVCALLLAFTTILPEIEVTMLLFFVIPVKMKAKWIGRLVIGTSLLFALSGIFGDVGHLAHLGGAVSGWFYARRLGFGRSLWMHHFFRDRRKLWERRERMNPTEFISEEIDPILDKISREGIHSLTRAERRVLELGRDKIARKTSGQ